LILKLYLNQALGIEIHEVPYVDKAEELNYVKNHPDIPEKLKPKLLEFLENHSELFSGEEFSDRHFPSNVYMHNVELTEPLTELKAKPFPCAGIRLAQLKDQIGELVKQKVLVPGDSEYVSPCFFVTKKPGQGKTASKGRLCYDYRKPRLFLCKN
jgi:hypothetical protein